MEQRGPPHGQGACLVVRVLTRAVENVLIWTGRILCCAVQKSQASAHVEHTIRQAASADSAMRAKIADAAKRKLSRNTSSLPSCALDRPVIVAACQTCQIMKILDNNGPR